MAEGKVPLKTPTQTVHIRNDSESFDELFRVLDTPQDNRSLPYIERNLPISFFNPPTPLHSRSKSSPAQIQHNSLSVSKTDPPRSAQQHVKQASMGDFVEPSQTQSLTEELPLPPGWESAKTPQGLRYFINHNKQETSWDDPRNFINNNNPTTLSQQPVAQISPAQTPPLIAQRTVQTTTLPQQQLQQRAVVPQPPQQSITGQTDNLQPLISTQSLLVTPTAQPPLFGNNQAVTGNGSSQPVTFDLAQQQALANLNISLGPLPRGWEQSLTPQGEIYFINHNDKSTSWSDPRNPNVEKYLLQKTVGPKTGQPVQILQVPSAQQVQVVSQPLTSALHQLEINPVSTGLSPTASQTVTPTHSPQPSLVFTSNVTNITGLNSDKLRLQQLQLQKQHIQRQEEELARKVQMQELMQRRVHIRQPSDPTGNPILQPLAGSSALSTSTGSLPGSIQKALLNDGGVGMDPMLGQGTLHHRQNSTDSGVGGMAGYSLHVKEDVVPVDEMDQDNRSTNGALISEQQAELNMDFLPAETGLQGMDTEDLISSLQSAECLQDILKEEPKSEPMDETYI